MFYNIIMLILPMYSLLFSFAYAHDTLEFNSIVGLNTGLGIWNGTLPNIEADYVISFTPTKKNKSCTATRVSHDFFITAAHCFKDETDTRIYMNYQKGSNLSTFSMDIEVTINDKYNGETGEHDLALFKVIKVWRDFPDLNDNLNFLSKNFETLDKNVGIANINYSTLKKYQPIWITGSGKLHPAAAPVRNILYTWGINTVYSFTNHNSFRSSPIEGYPLQSTLPGDSGGGVWDKNGNLVGVMSGSTNWLLGHFRGYYAHHLVKAPSLSASLYKYRDWIEPIINENKKNPSIIPIYGYTTKTIPTYEPYKKCKYIKDHVGGWTCFDTDDINITRLLPITGEWDQGYATKDGYKDKNQSHNTVSNVTLEKWHEGSRFTGKHPSMSLLMDYCFEEDANTSNCPGIQVANEMNFEPGVFKLCFRVNCNFKTWWHYSEQRLSYSELDELDKDKSKLNVCVEGTETVEVSYKEVEQTGIYDRDKINYPLGNMFADIEGVKEVETKIEQEKKKRIRSILRILW